MRAWSLSLIESQIWGMKKQIDILFNYLGLLFFNKLKTEFSWKHMRKEGWCNAPDRQDEVGRKSLGHKIKECSLAWFSFFIYFLNQHINKENVLEEYYVFRIMNHYKVFIYHSMSRDLTSDWEIKASSKKLQIINGQRTGCFIAEDHTYTYTTHWT